MTDIGKVIKGLRLKAKMTQAELAKRSGLDFTTISKIEKGSLIGTLATHQKIARALGMPLFELCRALEGPIKPVVEINQTKTKKPSADIFYYNEKVVSQILVKHLSQCMMGPELLHLEKGGVTDLEQKPKGTEQFIFVHEGEVELKIDKAIHNIPKGATAYFAASLPHTIRNISSQPAKVLRVTTPPSL